MSYVFDNSPLSVLFKNYYRRTFRSLWERFDQLVADDRLVSTREALREIEDGAPDNLRNGPSSTTRCLRLRQPQKALSLRESTASRPTARPWRSFAAIGCRSTGRGRRTTSEAQTEEENKNGNGYGQGRSGRCCPSGDLHAVGAELAQLGGNRVLGRFRERGVSP
jgi:hypothetical protein